MRKYKVNDINDVNVGDTLFILEGASTEFEFLESIFTKRFGFNLIGRVRGKQGYILKRGTKPYRIFTFNYKCNQLDLMNLDELDKLYAELRNNYGFNPEDASVYLIYDRDVESYERKKIDIKNDYILKYTDCKSENYSGYDGLLILSYPSIESYLTSCFIENTYREECKLGKQLKVNNPNTYKCHWGNIHKEKYNSIKDRLIIAAEEMDKALSHFGIDEYDIDEFYKTSIKVFDKQEEVYKANGKFKLLSLLSIVFMQMGIIVEEDEVDLSQPRRRKAE